MKILVYNTAAADGGALFVLKSFYEDVIKLADEDIQWQFVVSQDIFTETDKVKVSVYPKVKRSWLSRWKFEKFELPKIIKAFNPDYIVSLQNMPIKGTKKPQLVYLHQSLQYCPKKFSYLKGEERALAVRQRIVCGFYKRALPKAKHIFVQTNWIKDATVQWLKRSEAEVTVVPVGLNELEVFVKPYQGARSRKFFYPARAEVYKNHQTILNACKILKDEGIDDFEMIFTIDENDNACAKRLVEEAKGLPVSCIGSVKYEDIWSYYAETVLLFPSYLETCGLPLLEARRSGGIVLASDLPFAHEALDGYAYAEFFRFDDAKALAGKMKAVLDGRNTVGNERKTDDRKGESLAKSMLEWIKVNG